MIAVDTSAFLAIALNEPAADACVALLVADDDVLISAGTLAEFLIVSSRRGLGSAATDLLDRFRPTVLSVTEASAGRIGDAYSRWGKGVHPAGLNMGDCFAYVVAKENDCPLLYVGDDFSQTDVISAL